jgi:hypothetical protein
MKKQILIVTAATLTAAVVILNGTCTATAQQTPQYQVGGFPITSLQMSVLQPSARAAIGHVRFTPNSDIDCVFRHVWFGPQADITSSIRSLLGAQRWQSMASEHHDSSSASSSDHLSLDYRQSEQQDYPERTGISL